MRSRCDTTARERAREIDVHPRPSRVRIATSVKEKHRVLTVPASRRRAPLTKELSLRGKMRRGFDEIGCGKRCHGAITRRRGRPPRGGTVAHTHATSASALSRG